MTNPDIITLVGLFLTMIFSPRMIVSMVRPHLDISAVHVLCLAVAVTLLATGLILRGVQ